MTSHTFRLNKWPKRHAHVVEACRMLDVRDVLPDLNPGDRPMLRSWNPPMHPGLTLVPHRGGPLRRWWFLCPRCGRRCETLFIPPDVAAEDWRCRRCVCHGGLVYASQRHGRRHLFRQRLTPRKHVTHSKAAARLRCDARPREETERCSPREARCCSGRGSRAQSPPAVGREGDSHRGGSLRRRGATTRRAHARRVTR
jgi:hypothetical protein